MSSKPAPTPFTKQDAVEMIAIAQEAPIPGGARQAAARSELYNRFAGWFEQVTAEQAATPPKARKSRSAPAEPTAEELTK